MLDTTVLRLHECHIVSAERRARLASNDSLRKYIKNGADHVTDLCRLYVSNKVMNAACSIIHQSLLTDNILTHTDINFRTAVII